jgi:hypothetical protein
VPGPLPRYDTLIKLTPVIILNNSPDTCCVVPTPDVAMSIEVGFALAYEMNSGTVRAGTAGLTSMTLATRAIPPTGAMSRMIEVQLLVKRRVDHVGRVDEQQRVAVGRRIHDSFRGDVIASTGTVFDDEGLAQSFRQPLANQAGHYVRGPAGSITNNEVDWPVRKRLRPRNARDRGESGSARGQVEKFSAVGKFHDVPDEFWR